MTNSYTYRKQCNHTLHLILTVVTFGMWTPVWLVAALLGRKETVSYTGPVPLPAPQPNAVNPYNGHAYYDPSRSPLHYPPGHPVNYGR